MKNLPASKLIKSQSKTITVKFKEDTKKRMIDVEMRFDDECSNGYNTFSIVGDLWRSHVSRHDSNMISGGCIHSAISKHAGEELCGEIKLKDLIKWHLTSTDGPIHYIANTIYHAESGNLKHARDSAVWPDATIEQLSDQKALEARLPQLMEDFKRDMEAAGFTY